MKTTIDIADPLLRKAKQRAARDGTTLRALVESGLETILSENASAKKYRLKIKPFRGGKIRPGLETLDWDNIRDIVYEDEDRFR